MVSLSLMKISEAADDDTVSRFKSMTEERKEELRFNERLMNILSKYDEDTFIEGGTTTVEAKLFELEMRNEELRRMLENTDIRNEDSAVSKLKALKNSQVLLWAQAALL